MLHTKIFILKYKYYMKEPKVIFLTGVSGSGKTTMMDLLLEDDQFEKVCSLTTRKPRDWEISWDHYVFVSVSEFEELIQEKKMLEYAFVHQIAYYGTRLDWIEESLSRYKSPVKTIDMVGMEIIEKKWKIDGQYVCIFLDISEEVMKKRILMRQPDMNDLELQHRLDSAAMERNIAHRLQNCIVLDGSGSIGDVFGQIKLILKDI